jgi:Ca2+/Na+ antiporter
VNIGVLAVTSVLGGTEIAAGLGLGLFGVLSIIRLRSSEISQREVAYYFSALAMGLIGGLATDSLLVPVALIVMILAVMWFADHPALLARSRHQVVRLDRAIADEGELRGELERRLGGRVTSMTVQDLDFVNDTALVDVRYRLPQPTRGRLVAPLRTRAVQIASGEAR